MFIDQPCHPGQFLPVFPPINRDDPNDERYYPEEYCPLDEFGDPIDVIEMQLRAWEFGII